MPNLPELMLEIDAHSLIVNALGPYLGPQRFLQMPMRHVCERIQVCGEQNTDWVHHILQKTVAYQPTAHVHTSMRSADRTSIRLNDLQPSIQRVTAFDTAL
jgi:hypothetical protein